MYLQSLQTKQADLLTRLDELDQECAGLRETLEEVEEHRHKLQVEVEDIQSRCSGLQKQLQEEQVGWVKTACMHAITEQLNA